MLGYNLPNFQKNEEKQSVRELVDDVFKEQAFLTHDKQNLDKSVPREDQSVRKDHNVFTRLDKSTALL